MTTPTEARMLQRRATTTEWGSANPILASGEIGVDLVAGGFKIGNGINHFADLPLFIDGATVQDLIDAGDATTLASAYSAISSVNTGLTSYIDTQLDLAIRRVITNVRTNTGVTTDLTDEGRTVELTNAAASTYTVSVNSSVNHTVGCVISIYAAGAGGVTIVPDGGVTIRNNGTPLTQYQEVSIRQRATNEWVRIG